MTSLLRAMGQPSPREQSLELFRHVYFPVDCCLNQVLLWIGEPKQGGQMPGLSYQAMFS